jgi:hypothetical protein
MSTTMPGNAEFDAEFFNNASAEWRANKRQIKGTGTFVYIINECTHIKKNKKRCTNHIWNSHVTVCKFHK